MDYNEIGYYQSRIKKYLRENHIKQAQLAELINITNPQLRGFLKGECTASCDTSRSIELFLINY